MAKNDGEVTVRKGEVERMPTRVLRPFDEMERMFDDFFGRRWLTPFRRERPLAEFGFTEPKVDVLDRDDDVLVRAEMPGVKKNEVEISISGPTLTIRGETKHEEKEEKGDYYRCEISRGSFSRMLTLPADVDESKAKATMKDGILELTLPKLEKSRRRTIKID
jgi:HSP20 family protein